MSRFPSYHSWVFLAAWAGAESCWKTYEAPAVTSSTQGFTTSSSALMYTSVFTFVAKKLGRHDVTVACDDPQNHHWCRELCLHGDGNFIRELTEAPGVSSVGLAVHRKDLFIAEDLDSARGLMLQRTQQLRPSCHSLSLHGLCQKLPDSAGVRLVSQVLMDSSPDCVFVLWCFENYTCA